MAVLAVNDVALTVGESCQLSGIDFSLNAGEIIAVLGPNGAGKTSLIKLISGERKPESGSVLFNQKQIGQWRESELAKTMAVLPQQSLLNFSFTVEEVVMLGRTPHSTGVNHDVGICNEVLAAVDILHLKKRSYPSLSGGEKQRVQLARVLAQVWEPAAYGDRLIILDEPTSSLDLAHAQQVLQAVKAMAEQGCAVIVVMHDINLAAQFADRLLLLNDGQLIAQGVPESVLTAANIRSVFGVSVTIMPHPKTQTPMVIQ